MTTSRASATRVCAAPSKVFQHLIVPNRVVVSHERGHRAGVNDCMFRHGPGKFANCVHRYPTREHQKLHLIADIAPAQKSALESRRLAQLTDDFLAKVFRIPYRLGLLCPAAPLANKHAFPPPFVAAHSTVPRHPRPGDATESLSAVARRAFLFRDASHRPAPEKRDLACDPNQRRAACPLSTNRPDTL